MIFRKINVDKFENFILSAFNSSQGHKNRAFSPGKNTHCVNYPKIILRSQIYFRITDKIRILYKTSSVQAPLRSVRDSYKKKFKIKVLLLLSLVSSASGLFITCRFGVETLINIIGPAYACTVVGVNVNGSPTEVTG